MYFYIIICILYYIKCVYVFAYVYMDIYTYVRKQLYTISNVLTDKKLGYIWFYITFFFPCLNAGSSRYEFPGLLYPHTLRILCILY